MGDENPKAAQYRKQAAACLEVARQMSLIADRELMLKMAEQWLELARQVEQMDKP